MSSRHIQLPGCLNLRDIGGYPTRMGGTTAWGRLYRGAAFAGRDEAEASNLVSELGLTRVVDLRTEDEVQEEAPVIPRHSGRLVNLPFFPRIRSEWVSPADKSPRAAADRYMEMLGDGLPAMVRIVDELRDIDRNPTLIHCAVGRDRTGIVTACLLDLLEVPDEVITEDYAYSDRAIKDGERAHAETMLLFLSRVREAYGSTRDMLLDRGVSDATLRALERGLLE